MTRLRPGWKRERKNGASDFSITGADIDNATAVADDVHAGTCPERVEGSRANAIGVKVRLAGACLVPGRMLAGSGARVPMLQAEDHLVMVQFAVTAPEEGFGLFVQLKLLLGDFAHDAPV
jgi:hypothetical protein